METNKRIIKIGMDVHNEIFRLCAKERTLGGNVLLRKGETDPDAKMVSKFVKGLLKDLKLKKSECEIELGYEAGCLGFSLYWDLKKLKYDCIIVAPSSLTQTKGVRQKNDARDAKRLANDMCNHTYSEVHVPDPLDEAVRDFLRLRQDAVGEAKRIKQQLNAYAARKGFVYSRTKWTDAHFKWLNELPLDGLAKEVLNGYLSRLTIVLSQIDTYDQRIVQLGELERYKEPRRQLECFLGVRTNTAMSLLAEVSDFSRFPTAGHFAAFLGLVPHENTSGLTPTMGSITKAGNQNLRRILVEAAAGICKGKVGYKSRDLLARQEGNRTEVIEYADRANVRLRSRFYSMTKRGVKRNVAIVATARELACFIWGMMTGNIAPRGKKAS